MSALKNASGTKQFAGIHVRKAGVTKAADRASIRTASGLVVFYRSLASGGTTSGISVAPTAVFGTVNSTSSATVTSGAATVSVAGGVAPYTYAWSLVSGGPMAITAPTAASTTFSTTLLPSNSRSAVFKCTVTDSAGVSSDSPQVSADLENIGGTL